MPESATGERTAYSFAEAAELAGCSERQVWRFAKEKAVRPFKVGTLLRIPAEDIPVLSERAAEETDEPLLTVEELASQWGVGDRTIRRLIAKGELHSELKAGRRWIAPEDAQEYIDRQIAAAASDNDLASAAA